MNYDSVYDFNTIRIQVNQGADRSANLAVILYIKLKLAHKYKLIICYYNIIYKNI